MLAWVCAAVLALVGAVSFVMAWQGLSAFRLLPFHERAGGRDWDDVPPRERAVGLAFTRSLGLGFLVAGLALLGSATAVVAGQRPAALALGALAAVFCAGLAVVNLRLERATGTGTPWKGSLYAGVAVVADTGPGIDPRHLPHLFERSYRTDPASGTPGTGLGLAIAAEIAQAHGGTIEVRSILAEGSAFTVHLPRG